MKKIISGLILVLLFAGCGDKGGKMEEKELAGMKSYVLENKYLSLTLIPEAGAKIYDLIFKPTKNNFCWHSPITPLKKPEYGASFIPYDCGGFDEMLPTVGECDWKGKHLADHGEAWALPWELVEKKIESDKIIFKTVCKLKESPFLIERTLILKEGEARIKIDYKITNISEEEWEYIWACHASISPGGEIDSFDKIFLPQQAKVNVWSSENNRLGERGTWHSWPITQDKDGNEVDLSCIGSQELGYADKLFTNELKEGWIAAGDIKEKEFIAFSFPVDKIPYAGLWINQGGWRGYTQLGIEPTNTVGDTLSEAVEDYLRKYDKLSGGESKEFSIYVSCVKGLDKVKSVTTEGFFIQEPLNYNNGKIIGKFAIPLEANLVIKGENTKQEILNLPVSPKDAVEIEIIQNIPDIYHAWIQDNQKNILGSLGKIEVK